MTIAGKSLLCFYMEIHLHSWLEFSIIMSVFWGVMTRITPNPGKNGGWHLTSFRKGSLGPLPSLCGETSPISRVKWPPGKLIYFMPFVGDITSRGHTLYLNHYLPRLPFFLGGDTPRTLGQCSQQVTVNIKLQSHGNPIGSMGRLYIYLLIYHKNQSLNVAK